VDSATATIKSGTPTKPPRLVDVSVDFSSAESSMLTSLATWLNSGFKADCPGTTVMSSNQVQPKKEDDPCFPSSSIVTMADGTTKRVDALEENDSILSATLDGGLAADTVSFLSIADKAARDKEFLAITTDDKKTLFLTAEHHLPVGDTCCSTIVKAGSLKVGDTVWTVSSAAPLPVEAKVAKVEVKKDDGLHSPVLANGGLPIVDGVVTSFDSLKVVQTTRAGFSALIKACKATGTCNLAQKLFGSANRVYI